MCRSNKVNEIQKQYERTIGKIQVHAYLPCSCKNVTIATVNSYRFQFFVDLIMPQIMVEAFAKSLIDKIMLEAFDVVDTNEGKQLLYFSHVNRTFR